MMRAQIISSVLRSLPTFNLKDLDGKNVTLHYVCDSGGGEDVSIESLVAVERYKDGGASLFVLATNVLKKDDEE